jgi:hypothetical protein
VGIGDFFCGVFRGSSVVLLTMFCMGRWLAKVGGVRFACSVVCTSSQTRRWHCSTVTQFDSFLTILSVERAWSEFFSVGIQLFVWRRSDTLRVSQPARDLSMQGSITLPETSPAKRPNGFKISQFARHQRQFTAYR